MEKRLFEVASRIATPLSLASLIIIALYLLYRAILELDVFSTIEAGDTYTLLNRMLILLFTLALVGLVLGVISYGYVQYLKHRQGEDSPKGGPRLAGTAIDVISLYC